ncbi:MAG: HipA domain-containing protein, partial [Pseudomonadota bacterium]|nr:HipA domain-containing protein [Pseudomonadota bacterium]
QVLIGNTDAHAKNLSFFLTAGGLSIAPAYDLVNVLALADERIETNYAMAIGNAFRYGKLAAEEWTDMALSCGLSARLVANELIALTKRVQAALPETAAEVLQEGALPHVVERVRGVTATQCEQLAAMAIGVRRPDPRRRQTPA